jgi:hypothetical protein
MTSGDDVLDVMLMLKNDWSLTGDLLVDNILFGTRFYDKNLQLPQVIVSPITKSPSPPIDIGSSEATYPNFQEIRFDISVRPKQDSNSSLGWAKMMIYEMRKEAERILRSGSHIGDTSSGDSEDIFIYLRGWTRQDDLSLRPILFHFLGRAFIVKYVKGS